MCDGADDLAFHHESDPFRGSDPVLYPELQDLWLHPKPPNLVPQTAADPHARPLSAVLPMVKVELLDRIADRLLRRLELLSHVYDRLRRTNSTNPAPKLPAGPADGSSASPTPFTP